jgi:hypothetical protein
MLEDFGQPEFKFEQFQREFVHMIRRKTDWVSEFN